MNEAQPMGQGWTMREPDSVGLSRRARRRRMQCWGPRRTSSKRSRRSYRPLDMHKLMQEASLPVMRAPQVNVSLVKTFLEALTGLIENVWNPEAGPPPDKLIHAIQARVEANSSDLISDLFQDPEIWDQDEDEAEEMEGSEEAHAPGGPTVEDARLWRNAHR